MTLQKLNFHLLTTLGLSHDSAEIVMDHIGKLENERDELAAWKAEALLVESRWDCQKVGKLLRMTLGHDIRPNIEPKIRALLETLNDRDETIKNLEARVYDLRAQFIAADHHRCVLRAAAEALCDAWHDEQAQSSNIEPLVDALDSAVRITPMGDDARHQVETKLSDALVENAHLKEALARGDCKDSAADVEILRDELVRLRDFVVDIYQVENINAALKAIEL